MGGGKRALVRIDVVVCYTRGAGSRRWCGCWRDGGGVEIGGRGNCSSGMDDSKTIIR